MSGADRRVARLAVTLIGLVAALIGLTSIRSWDLWWHLATGRLALAEGSTLPVDPFSLTRAGEPWVYKDLGADIGLWWLYDTAGPAGLAVFKLAVALALATLLALLVRRRTRAVWALLALAGTALVVASFRVIVRPEAFTLLGLPALLLLLERWRRQPAPRGGGLALVIWALVLLWANLHRGVVLGVSVLVGYALYELLGAVERRLGRPGRWFPSVVTPAERPGLEASKSVVLAAGAALLTLLNPSGTALWRQSLAVGTSDKLAASVSEWASLSIGELWTAFPVAVLWMVAVVLVVPVGFWRARTRGGDVDLWDVGLAALGVFLGLSAVRLLPLMAALTVLPMAGAAATLWERGTVPKPSLLATSLAALLLVALAWANPRIGESRPGMARDWYPGGAVALMAEAPVVGHGFTTFTFAGYVLFHLWPDQRVMCDGRFDTVYDEATMHTCLAAERDPPLFRELVERYELEWVLAHNRPVRGRSFDWLDADPDWVLIDWDAASLLYVRRAGPNTGLAGQLGFSLLRPHDVDVSLMQALVATSGSPRRRAQLENEVRRLQAAAPDDYRTYVVVALFLYEIGAVDTEEYRLVVEGLRLRRDDDPAAVNQVLEWIGER